MISINYLRFLLLVAGLITICSCGNTTTGEAKKFDSAAFAAQCREDARPAYIEAYTMVNTIKEYIRIGNDQEALMLYKQNLAPEMGYLDDVSKIKQKLDSSGQKYVMYKWYKAAAIVAEHKAAESKFEADQIRADTIK